MEWNGYEMEKFLLDGREGLLVLPKTWQSAHRWVWRTEFFGAFDYADRALLQRGWAIAYYKVSDQYGSPQAIRAMKAFHEYVVKTYGLCEKADLFGFSRGGLYAVNYAAKYPSDVRTIYLDAPVLDLASWPAMLGENKPYCTEDEQKEWEHCKEVFGFKEDQDVYAYKEMPIKKADVLVENHLPVILVAGDSDKTVAFSENGEPFAKAFRQKGGEMEVIVKHGVDHHPHSLEDPSPIVAFISSH